MPLETLFTNPLPAIPPPKSIISRITSPLAKRNRNIADFSIEPEHQWKTYGPGDLVKGNVLLTVAKGFDVTHLVTCLHGYAKVYKHQVVPGESVVADGILDIRGGNQGVEYRGNGLVSLFQDEVALCGDGFLKKGIYKFGFELEFPAKSLPSSIDFERGTVSYFITATLTRPNSIAPTTSCYRPIKFQDSIDIGHMSIPKPRVISLEPILKRGRVKVKMRHASLEKPSDTPSRREISRTNTESSTYSNRPVSEIQPPQSPAPSEDTAVSRNSTSTNSFQVVSLADPAYPPSTKDSEARSSTTSASSQTITATSELERQGALPGDTIAIRVNVIHNKPNVRGLVIATLYRQGRIDLHPAIPLASKGKTKKPEYEDIFPRSKSGLGGLHLSNGSPNSVFRKDLSQSTATMIVNPKTMTADVKTSIKLPENAFPTMSNVPGGMISFRYYVEVVVDLCGKLGEPRFLPRLTSMEPSFTGGADNISQSNSDWANNILDTLQLRRTKSVVDFTFAVIVGTKDSARTASRWAKQDDNAEQEGAPGFYPRRSGLPGDQEHYDVNSDYYGEWGARNECEGFEYDANDGQSHNLSTMELIPPPPPAAPVDEKEWLRRQEALLLPSQPPDEGDSSTVAEAAAPSAPFIPEDAGPYDYRRGFGRDAGPSTPGVARSAVSTRSGDTIVNRTGPRSPRNPEPPTFDDDTTAPLQDDKQDLERRRLMAQASAPPEEGDDASMGLQSSANEHVPTAPVLDEVEEYNARTLSHEHMSGEHLPQYWR